MHIPDGFLDTNTVLATYVISAAAVGYGLKEANEKLGEKQVPLVGVTSAFIFAAQMINFPIAGGTSGHFLGAALAAVLLGPWIACLIMTVVLGVQCLGFADGGLTALGANIFNMGIIGGIVTYYIFLAVKKMLPKNRRGFLASVAFVSWLSVVLGASACALELAISGTAPLKITLTTMISFHVIIGIGEAIITTTVIGLILKVRPDLVSTFQIKTQNIRPERGLSHEA